MNIVATVALNYNGWSVAVDGDYESPLAETLMEELPSVTHKFCDEDGYMEDIDERVVVKAVAKIVKQEHTLTIEYDERSS